MWTIRKGNGVISMSAYDEEEEEDTIENLEPDELYKQRQEMFIDLFKWVQRNVHRTNRLKGWTVRGRNSGEMISLLHAELSECLEWLRHDNPKSDHIPEVSGAEEELADVIIRLMDFAHMRGWNIPKALFLKMEYNKTRPIRHGGKKF